MKPLLLRLQTKVSLCLDMRNKSALFLVNVNGAGKRIC